MNPPEFTSAPVLTAFVGQLYRYAPQAVDADGDPIQFGLVGDLPFHMQIFDGENITWQPGADQIRDWTITVDARDGNGGVSEQTFTIQVQDVTGNNPPIIASEPDVAVEAGAEYHYRVVAQDLDGDPLQFSLTESPATMTIGQFDGEINWRPTTDDIAFHRVTVRVDDGRLGHAIQSFSLAVVSSLSNAAPVIESAPVLTAQVGMPYQYRVQASDPDGDAVSFAFVEAPDGMTIDRTSGRVEWQPTSGQVGPSPVVIVVSDGRGGVARQQFTVLVNDTSVNQPPEITSTPPMSGTAGVELVYLVQANDPDGDVLSFALAQAPAGAVSDSVTGQLRWIPGADQTGEQAFEIRVTDGNGGLAVQRFTVFVQPPAVGNRPPEIGSSPPFGAKTGREYAYDMVVEDPDGDVLNFTLAEGPASMSIDGATGQLRWTPQQVGAASVRVEVSDGEFTVFQQWQIEILDGTVPLSLELVINPQFPEIGQTVEIQLLPESAAGQVMAEVTINGGVVPVDPGLIARFVPSAAGEQTVLATVDDGFEQASAEDTFRVSDPGAEGGPVATLLSPDFDAELTTPVGVRGALQGDGIVRWILAYTEIGSQDFAILAEGTDAFDPTDLAQFDPTLLLNGQYRIVLQAWDDQGRTGVDSREVRVTGDMKVGHFSITFEDLSIPVSGIPITVSRTYDTRQRHKPLDFGHGWTIDYQNVRVQESRRLGLGWDIVQFRSGPFGAFVEFCVLPQGEPLVTVTLPDGSVETFEVHIKNECNDFIAVIDFLEFDFQPIDGTLSTLTESDFSGSMRLVNGNLVENGTFSIIADPTNYTLTTKDGFVFELDQNFGIRTVIDPNDNTLTYTDDGILHSSGKSVLFNRDTSGRITDIVDPKGNVLSYEYDGVGDLIAFADREQHVTQFGYLSGYFLEDIIDPRGVRAIRNEYDEDGRLIAQIDADGNRIEFTHDIEGRLEIVKDRRGNSTVHVYDDHGNVISETNALGETTQRTYDDFGNELTRTDPLGNVWSAAFDEDFNQIEDTNPLGETNASSYNDRGLLLTQTAPDGTVILSNQYDGRDNPTAITDALGQTTEFDYAFFGL
ncbi:MAG: putative Ig domain-containing protein, partial [Xanthomonadaceae bacterium]|nr:putative Ig domain-containing protein [Xanthomonadaceae bacterium]